MNTAKSKGNRRKARELALSALYMLEMQSGKEEAKEPDIIEQFFTERAPSKKVLEFARRLVNGVQVERAVIDRHIEGASKHWKLSRIARIDRNIMRLAAFEILYETEIPPQVSINEAVEIAKKYGSEESSAFVNGILDSINRSKK